MEFQAIRSKICGNFQFTKNFIAQKIRRKSQHFTLWRHANYLERIWWLNHHFIIKKNKELDTRLKKPNFESSFIANIELIEKLIIKLIEAILRAKYFKQWLKISLGAWAHLRGTNIVSREILVPHGILSNGF